MGLEVLCLRPAQPDKVADAVLLRPGPDGGTLADVVVGRGDDQLSRALRVDMHRPAVVVQQFAALDAELRLEAAARIVDPRMNDLRVARRRLAAEVARLVDDQNIASALGQRTGDRQSDDARSDDDDFHGFDHDSPLVRPRTQRPGHGNMAALVASPTSAREGCSSVLIEPIIAGRRVR